MPVYEIETPDGRIVEIEAASAGAAAIGARDYVKNNPKKKDPLRNVKMGARDLARGAAGFVDIIGAPVNTTINALTGSRLNEAPARNLVDMASRELGVDEAQNNTERMTGAVNEFAGGSLAGSGLGSLVSKAPGALGTAGRSYAEKPILQAGVSAAGGAPERSGLHQVGHAVLRGFRARGCSRLHGEGAEREPRSPRRGGRQ